MAKRTNAELQGAITNIVCLLHDLQNEARAAGEDTVHDYAAVAAEALAVAYERLYEPQQPATADADATT